MRTRARPGPIVCIGAAAVDRIFFTEQPALAGTSNPARVRSGFGGVARNVAENLARLGARVSLFSVVGDDEGGRAMLQQLADAGCDVSGVRTLPRAATAEYAAVIGPDGELFTGACDAHVLESLSIEDLDRWLAAAAEAQWVFLDCNLPRAILAACVDRRSAARWHLAVDGTSVAKVRSLPEDLSAIDLLFVNRDEAAVLGRCNARNTVISRGARGISIVAGSERTELCAPSARAVNVTGAGDALIAGTLYGLLQGRTLDHAARAGLRLAARTVESPAAVWR
jgi:pseudouridine kinase